VALGPLDELARDAARHPDAYTPWFRMIWAILVARRLEDAIR
jgi:hypothetical protein